MSNDRYKKIRRALANGPTPGPWRFARTNSGVCVKSERLAGYFVEVRRCRATQNVDADAYLISACDPDTIRSLLDERDALAAEVERLVEALWELEERAQRDEALLRQALEALLGQRGEPDWQTSRQREAAIAALRERLGEKE